MTICRPDTRSTLIRWQIVVVVVDVSWRRRSRYGPHYLGPAWAAARVHIIIIIIIIYYMVTKINDCVNSASPRGSFVRNGLNTAVLSSDRWVIHRRRRPRQRIIYFVIFLVRNDVLNSRHHRVRGLLIVTEIVVLNNWQTDARLVDLDEIKNSFQSPTAHMQVLALPSGHIEINLSLYSVRHTRDSIIL